MSQFSRQELNFMKNVFTEYGKIYGNIFGHLYPAKNSTGFPERNLSVNFSKAYEKVATTKNQNAISWFEFQFGRNNKLHLDAVVINTSSNALFLVEAKRPFNNEKISEIGEDIDRIYSCLDELRNTDNDRISNMEKYRNIYGVVLADAWPKELKLNESILQAFKKNNFLTEFSTTIKTNHKEISDEKYYVSSDFKFSIYSYYLLSFMWKI